MLMTPEEQEANRRITRAGNARFEELAPLFEPEHARKFVVIDTVSGDYEIDAWMGVAERRLLARRPDADIFIADIGHPAVFKARSPRRFVFPVIVE